MTAKSITDKRGSSLGLADPVLLEKIDMLFACNVGDYVDLPQLVVVGDQSSGKSSVLEGLTDLPFPRDSGLCTRFATQITFRRAAVESITVSIIPAKDASIEHAEKVQCWVKADLQSLDAKAFADIMVEVRDVMGLSGPQSVLSGSQKTFSDDVLRLEVCGPKQEHLSIIDVPGIFKKTTQGVTTKSDMEMVRSMVHRYMQNPRSVMLVVIPANVDIATQEILEMAEEVDPDGLRTLGVLTKPDLVDKGAELAVVDLIEGNKHKLSLGWHMVRNPGQLQISVPYTDRHSIEEAFFKQVDPWNTLEKDKVGIQALRTRLQGILADHTRREFPKVKAEINKSLRDCKTALGSLGAKRETSEDQRRYVLDVAMEFQRITTLALDVKYGSDDIFDQNSKLRLPTTVQNRSETFSNDIELKGHTFEFLHTPPDQDLESDPGSVTSTDGIKIIESKGRGKVDNLTKIRSSPNHPDLEDIMYDQDAIPGPNDESILTWLTEVYTTSRGFEIGTFDPSLLAIILKKQSTNWNGLALGYISDVVFLTHSFIMDLLQLICSDRRVQIGLRSMLMDGLISIYRHAFEHVQFILKVERTGTPRTLNHYFNENLETRRQQRIRDNMAQKSFDGCKHGTVVRLDDIIQTHPMSNTEHIVQDLHDILESYYKVARKRFVDIVCMQGTDHYLITGPKSPLKLFSPTFVIEMSPQQLEEVAGEDVALKRKRKQLQKEILNLEAGKKILY